VAFACLAYLAREIPLFLIATVAGQFAQAAQISNYTNTSRDHERRTRAANSGFTLVEILLVVSILGLILAVSVPASYEMYLGYKSSLRAEEVLTFVANLRRESFLYGEESVLSSVEGNIQYGDGKLVTFADTFVQIDAPIRFYKNGTTSGGELQIQAGGFAYRLNISAPFGNLLLEPQG